ncbi:MAG TPA: dihydroorotase [Chitinophagaceae bacterium]|nr:dihydroorotase [Chitinophagaceae bacterium]
MQILIRQAQLIDPQGPFHGSKQDILISDGIIEGIGKFPKGKAEQIIEGEGICVSPGWMDVFAHFCDPGTEYKEDLFSGQAAAARGGFTAVMILPDTRPPLQSKAEIEYIRGKAAGGIVDIYPIGALSLGLEGNLLAEMYDMRKSGAIAFSNGLNPIQSSGILLKALQYVKAFDGVIIQVPEDRSVSRYGLMNEGIASTRIGMPGKPAIAEELMIRRDLELAKYAGSRIHFTGVSTEGSVALIRQAKSEGIRVTASVTPYHLCLTDASLSTYDTRLKVNPPLRTAGDVEALKEGLADGTIDCVASHHIPQDADSKEVEFEYAKEGMIGLETCFSLMHEALDRMSLEAQVSLLSQNPRRIFGLEPLHIQEREQANLTIFNPDLSWTFQKEDIRSRSRNTPFTGKSMKGKVIGVLNQGKVALH